MNRNELYVIEQPQGGWAVRRPYSQKPISVHSTQREAELRAKEIVGKSGGGEVRIQDRYGRWRDSDTVAPGNDPYPPRDTR